LRLLERSVWRRYGVFNHVPQKTLKSRRASESWAATDRTNLFRQIRWQPN
jgi:hypothetical protein